MPLQPHESPYAIIEFRCPSCSQDTKVEWTFGDLFRCSHCGLIYCTEYDDYGDMSIWVSTTEEVDLREARELLPGYQCPHLRTIQYGPFPRVCTDCGKSLES